MATLLLDIKAVRNHLAQLDGKLVELAGHL